MPLASQMGVRNRIENLNERDFDSKDMGERVLVNKLPSISQASGRNIIATGLFNDLLLFLLRCWPFLWFGVIFLSFENVFWGYE